MLHIAIYDSGPESAQILEKLLRKRFSLISGFSIKAFSTYSSLLREAKLTNYDLVFFEIINNGGSCLCTLKKLRIKAPEAELIFLSEDAFIPFEAAVFLPLYYLKKPIEPREVEKAVSIFIDRKQLLSAIINTPGSISAPISLYDVIFFEIFDKTINIHLAGNSIYSFKGQLGHVERCLKPYHFIRCHKSYLINPLYVQKLLRTSVILTDNTNIPIGKTYADAVQREVKEYFSNFVQIT